MDIKTTLDKPAVERDVKMSSYKNIKGKGVKNGAEFLESLRDDRVVFYKGERVKDVTTHPIFSKMAHKIAESYDKQHEPEYQDKMSFIDEDGIRCSYSYAVPDTKEILAAKRTNTDVWVNDAMGMLGRLPDFVAGMTVGMYDIRHELAKLNPEFGQNAADYLKFARQNDLCLSHGLHDPCMDKSLRPSQDPDRCVRVVKERDDGIIVRGARFNTFGLYSNEIMICPTYGFKEDEKEFAIWFTVPCDAPGLSQIAREAHGGRNPLDHPASAVYDEVDSLIIFDDVFIPWERIFLYREPLKANQLFRSNVMTWASFAGGSLTILRLEILCAIAEMLAKTSGVINRPEVIAKLGEMCTYMGAIKSSFELSMIKATKTAAGNYKPALAPERRSFTTMVSERFIELIEHIGTSSLIFLPTAEDWNNPEIKEYLDVYMRGKDSSPMDRHKLCKFAWDLSGDGYGARQQMYERLHSGDPNVMVANAWRNTDLSHARSLIADFLELEGDY
ncbi:MAG: hypothetical protein H6912_04460 [Kordiimonadaceae bacterium]|nr:hypothetical protein [Kordiimonadaceae bacterium]